MKKILAIAIASAFAAPAFAATSNVDVYGYIHMSVDVLDDGTNSGTNVSSNASALGFKGSEDLGGGLNAIWQVETQLAGERRGSSFTTARDTFVGLKGGFGTIRLGYFDTPTKNLSRKLDLFVNRIGDTRNLLRTNASNGALSSAANAWEERFDNGIRYDTPSFSGFSASVHYSTNFDNTGATNNNNTDAYSLGANYENGPLFAGLTYQRNNLTVGTGDETNWRLGAGYNLGDLKMVALYSKAQDQRGVNGADRDVWGLGASYKLGNGAIKGQFYKADSEDNTNDTGAKMYVVGYDYSLSKRTLAYIAYAKTKNDANAQFSAMGGGGHGDDLTIGAGKDPDAFSIGMIHTF
ncbi:porin [Thiobacillus sp.]|uniref:porin n=1 Tax=Thiobacillus sp. TaxID=924 RepID=UPI0017D7AEA3|nr:porin [Thiobacillus sp.]MBC2732563.1 porin [Thiobacillus sp.]MBC2741301.1 porin [Thiobacillus sp.]MBC2759040.1 porin [Thiobacillus sp.]